jgi:hypothetical protein
VTDPGEQDGATGPLPEPRQAGGIYRIVWIRGEDQLRGICPCGAELLHDDPVELMTWLYGHPDGHGPSVTRPRPDPHVLVPGPVGVRR